MARYWFSLGFSALLAIAVLTGGSQARDRDTAASYRNERFGFAVKNLTGRLHCVGDAANAGVDILLDDAKNCEDITSTDSAIRRITIYGSYNLPDGFTSLPKIAGKYCYPADVAINEEYAPRVGRHKSAGCRIDHADGRVEVIAFTLKRTAHGNPENWIQIAVRLTSTQDHIRHDLTEYRNAAHNVLMESSP